MSKALTFEAEPFELAYEVTRQSGTLNCGQVATPPCSSECIPLSQSELRKFKLKPVKKTNPKGEFIDRTEGNRMINKALQLIDYDVNEWRPCKPQHREALNQLTEFINSRLDNSNQPVTVTVTGSATRTDAKKYNDRLSCMRANCVAEIIKLGIHPARLRRVSINPSGEGFSKAPLDVPGQAEKRKEFRSVLVQVHAPDNPPPPIPVIPGWNKYKIRCCSYKSETLFEVALDALLSLTLSEEDIQKLRELPPWVKTLLTGLAKKLKEHLIKRVPELGKLLNKLSSILKYIVVDAIRVKAVYQIIEVGKVRPKELTLCYTGYGVRVKRLDVPNLEKEIDEFLRRLPNDLRAKAKAQIMAILGKLLEMLNKLQELKGDCAPPLFREFELIKLVGSSNTKVSVFEDISVFKGTADVHTGANIPGHVHLFFSTPKFNSHTGPRICCGTPCDDRCSRNGIVLQVGNGIGMEIGLVSHGELVSGDECRCSECVVVSRGAQKMARPASRPRFEFEMDRFTY